MTMVGQRLGSFLIERKIGSGAMGEVYHATRQLKDGRTRAAAVKVISAEFVSRDNALRRFEREAKILEQLRHPNIVRYYAYGRSQGTYYYAMEFVDGETLDDLLERREFLPWPEVVDLAIQLCSALHEAHQRSVVHRDLKPSNLMITKDGRVKLTDFGIAKDLEATVALTKTGRTLGTAAYMAPEQIRGTPEISHKTDLYALGCLMYQLLTGFPPFEGKSPVVVMNAHMNGEIPRPSGKNPEMPRALDDLVARLLSKHPQERPWDAEQVEYELRQLREKHRDGEPVAMVFDRARAAVTSEAEALRARSRGDAPPRRKRKGRAEADSAVGVDGPPLITRQRVETGLLVLALLALLGFGAYMLIPPGSEYLHAQAAALMSSDDLADWRRAERRYIEPLERRFPGHPFGDDVRRWRDRILLEEASRRSRALLGDAPQFNEPRNETERLFKEAAGRASGWRATDQHARAARAWQDFVNRIRAMDDPGLRGWELLGQARFEALRNEAEARRQAAMELYQRALQYARDGRAEQARGVLEGLLDDYSIAAEGDRTLAGLLNQVRAALATLDRPPDTDRAEGEGDGEGDAGSDRDGDGEGVVTPPPPDDGDGTGPAGPGEAGDGADRRS